MELPDWVVDDVLQPARPVAFRLAVMLYRYGRPMVGSAGERRVYWRGSTQALARLIGASRRALLDAEAELVELGLLTIHERVSTRSPHAISAPYDRQTGAIFAPVFESAAAPHDDDPDRSTDGPSEDGSITITSTEEAVQILHRFGELGVTAPERWLREFGVERCAAALDVFDASPATVRNPPGFLYMLLTSGSPLRTQSSQHHLFGSFEDRKRRYLGGALAPVRAGVEGER